MGERAVDPGVLEATPRVVAGRTRGVRQLEPRFKGLSPRPSAHPTPCASPFNSAGHGCRFARRGSPPGCGRTRTRQQIGAGDETVRGTFLYQREQLGEYGVLERGPGTRRRWCQGVQPPDARRSKRELVGGLIETMVHGVDKQFADLF